MAGTDSEPMRSIGTRNRIGYDGTCLWPRYALHVFALPNSGYLFRTVQQEQDHQNRQGCQCETHGDQELILVVTKLSPHLSKPSRRRQRLCRQIAWHRTIPESQCRYWGAIRIARALCLPPNGVVAIKIGKAFRDPSTAALASAKNPAGRNLKRVTAIQDSQKSLPTIRNRTS
jgi:hypothetical protein